MKKTIIAIISIGMLWATAAVASGHGAHWGYLGNEAPEYWGDLASEYQLCKKGNNQSPIDIDSTIEAALSPIIFHYQETSVDMVDNGHTVQLNYAPGSFIVIRNHRFELLQLHFHTPSENKVHHNFYPMEAHLVHRDKDGQLAVVAVFFEEGASNPLLDKLWPHMPTKVGQVVKLPEITFNVEEMLPADHSYYYFNGSLTTPPCTQGVAWMVLKTPATITRKQFQKFHDIIGSDNNRPIQPMNARPVLQ